MYFEQKKSTLCCFIVEKLLFYKLCCEKYYYSAPCTKNLPFDILAFIVCPRIKTLQQAFILYELVKPVVYTTPQTVLVLGASVPDHMSML